VLGACALLPFSINSGSLWIDEGFSAWIACHRTWSSLVDSLRIGDSSDLQMPLYYGYLWAWTKLFGASEYALRAANLPWGALLVTALAWTSRSVFRARFAWVPLVLCPFVWTYLNEARAYLGLMACCAASAGAVLVYAYGDPRARRWAPWLALSFLFAALTMHMLAAFLLPALAVVVFGSARSNWQRWCSDWHSPLSVFALPFVLLGCYFAWTFARGTNYDYGGPTAGYFLFALYEFAGFAGIGASRSVMRSGPVLPALLASWPSLLPGALALLIAGAILWKQRREPRVRLLALAWCAAYASAIVASVVVHNRFLGRHISASVPVLLLVVLAALASVSSSHAKWVASLCLVFAWGLSDARLTVLPAYQKDDYRGAVSAAVEEARSIGADLAWAADPLTGAYYGLKLHDDFHTKYYAIDLAEALRRVEWPQRANARAAADWDRPHVAEYLRAQRARRQPVVLALSKPDLFDFYNGWVPELTQMHAVPKIERLNFVIYVLR
jgi:hypothetical protein